MELVGRRALIDEIRRLEKQIQRNEETIRRALGPVYTKTLEDANETYAKRVEDLKEKLERGEFEVRQSNESSRQKMISEQVKKKQKEAREKGARMFKTERRPNLEQSYHHMMKTKLPKKEQAKLASMPSNHGILYKGVLFLGQQPPRKGPFKVTEMLHNGVLHTEETYGGITKVYENRPHEPRVLIGVYKRGEQRPKSQAILKE